MIHIVDYGAGNIGSIANMIRKVGGSSIITSNTEELLSATKLILPGVGHFDYGMKKLRESQLIKVLEEKVLNDRCPILGICLGAQLMTNSSEEGVERGLGWFDARVRRFSEECNVRIPHMGWNFVKIKKQTALCNGFYDESRFYFVHSYYIEPEKEEDVLFETVYGQNFTSGLCRDNLYAVQFHPEKSHKYGVKLMQNFIEL